MKRILIWNNFPLRNIGGQAGYCYNIHEYLKEHPREEITFLSDLIAKETKEKCEFEYPGMPTQPIAQPSRIRALIQSIPIYLKFWYPLTELLRKIKQVRWDVKVITDDFCNDFYKDVNEIPSTINLNDYDYIHFHWVQTMMQFKHSHPEYKGKIILTSHCPCPWTDERITFHKPIARYFRRLGIESECNGYRSADYIMFPCKDAREPYEKDRKIRKTFRDIDSKFFYVPTSILDYKVDKESYILSKNLGIPDNAFIITFFGRHNSIKGYDILKEIGERILSIHPNVYFVCAGRGDIKPLEHPHWIELGFIDNAAELHPQSDLYILPNRETYFDIGTLEVLRAGVHILMSETGGNKYFKSLSQEETVGIDFFEIENIDTVVEKVESLIVSKGNDIRSYKQNGEKNRELFLKYFTPDIYIENYLKEIEKLH